MIVGFLCVLRMIPTGAFHESGTVEPSASLTAALCPNEK